MPAEPGPAPGQFEPSLGPLAAAPQALQVERATVDDTNLVDDDDDDGEDATGLEVIADSESDSKPSTDMGALAAEARFSMEAGMDALLSRAGSKELPVPTAAAAAAAALAALTNVAEGAGLPPLLDDGAPPILGGDAAPQMRPVSSGRHAAPAGLPTTLPPLLTNEPRAAGALPSPPRIPAPTLAPPPRLPSGAPAMPVHPPSGPPNLGAAPSMDRLLPAGGVASLLVPPVIPPLPEELRFPASIDAGADSPAGGARLGSKAGGKSDSKAASSTTSEVADLDPGRRLSSTSGRSGATGSISPRSPAYRKMVPERIASTESVVAAAAAAKVAAEAAAAECMSRGVGVPAPGPSPLSDLSRGRAGSHASSGTLVSKDSIPLAIVMGTLERYSRLIVGYPKPILSAYLVVVMAVLVIGGIFKLPNFEIEEDFDTFIRADGAAMRNREAFLAALPERKGPYDRRRLQSGEAASAAGAAVLPLLEIGEGRLHKERRLTVAEDGAAHERRLDTYFYLVQTLTIVYPEGPGEFPNLEAELVVQPGWRKLCSRPMDSHNLWCEIGESMPAFSRPTEIGNGSSGVAFTMDFDRNGEGVPLSVTMTYMEETTAAFDPGDLQAAALTDFRRHLPRDYVAPSPYGPDAFAAPGSRPSATKTRFSFNFPLGSDEEPMDVLMQSINEAIASYKEEVAKTIWPFLVQKAEAARNSGKEPIYYYGDRIGGHEVKQVLYSDIVFALGSFVFVALYMRLHTRSFIVTFAGLMLIVVSVPLAYIFAPMGKVNVASFLSIFLLTGIGCDVIFVFTDFWDQSLLKEAEHARLSWTIAHAGRSCLATSITTAASFFANLGSALQTLREFGLFMGLCVMNVFFLTLLILPPILLLTERIGTAGSPRASSTRIANLGDVDVSAGQHIALVANHPGSPKSPSALSCNGRTMITDRDGLAFSRRQLLKLTGAVSRNPAKILLFTMTMVLVFAIGVAVSIEMQTTAPEIFPAYHNQVKSREWADKFADTEPPPRGDLQFEGALSADVCLPDAGMLNQRLDESTSCSLYWCDSVPSPSSAALADGTASTSSAGGIGGADGGGGEDGGDDAVSDGFEVASCWVGTPHARGVGPTTFASCDRASVATRLLSLEPPTGDATWRQEWHALLETSLDAADSRTLSSQMSTLRSMAMEDWSTGTIATTRYFSMGESELLWSAGEHDCRVDAICAVGPQVCRLPGWTYLGDIHVHLGPHVRLLQEPQEATVIAANQIHVTIVWGLRPALYTPVVGALPETWSFDPNFQPENPWAQRAMLAMCSHPWVQPWGELAVLDAECWVAGFRDHLRRQEKKFPSRDFREDVESWYNGEPLLGPENMWFEDGTLRATKVYFKVNKDKDMPSEAAAAYKQMWDDFVDARNAEASVTANFAWHTASKWVSAEAEEAIVSSTLSTIFISAASAWFGVLIFSGDPALACMVTLLVLAIILGLAFFMSCLMGWQIGPIEVISLVIFVGYSIDFSLHIAHSFGEVDPEDPEMLELEAIVRNRKLRHELAKRSQQAAVRGGQLDDLVHQLPFVPETLARGVSRRDVNIARVRTAVLRLGGATLSSAVSTVGSNVFLLCCTMNIFVKLGAVVIAVTIVSITFALIVLPAALMLCGPPHGPWFAKWVMSQLGKLCGGEKKAERDDGDAGGQEGGPGLGENGHGERLLSGQDLGFEKPPLPGDVLGFPCDTESGAGEAATTGEIGAAFDETLKAAAVEKVSEEMPVEVAVEVVREDGEGQPPDASASAGRVPGSADAEGDDDDTRELLAHRF